MWYAISIGSGLLLGLVLLIWALSERKKRYAAEAAVVEYRGIAENNAAKVDEIVANAKLTENERDMLAKEIVKMRDFILKNVDPEKVYDYISSSLDNTDI